MDFMGTLRQQIAVLLQQEPMTAMDISQAVRIPEKDVYRHLAHIQRSVAGQGKKLLLTPCTCRACGFVFRERQRLTRPGRCPRCRESRIDSPVFSITPSTFNKEINMPPSAIQDCFTGEHAICYGCGSDNAHGLQIRTYWDGEYGTFRFTPEDYHTAFPGVVYGGLIASLFDCHCIGTAIAAAYEDEGRRPGTDPSIIFVTANLNINYLRPTPMGSELLLKSHVVERKGKKTVVACTLSADDTPCADATVVGIRVS